jgi:uncharacterized protein
LHDYFFRKLSFSGKYTIQFKGLKDGFHSFEFEASDRFFEFFENQDVQKGSLTIQVGLTKKTGMLELDIAIGGSVNVLCDRCLDSFDHPVDFRGTLYVKFTGHPEDPEDPDVVFLSSEEHELDLARYFYESVILSLPYSKVHPDSEGNSSGCNPLMIEKLNAILAKDKKATDPRWDSLKGLKGE